MTVRNLTKLVAQNQNNISPKGPDQRLTRLLSRLQGKPFWIEDQELHKKVYTANKGNCCWNHIIKLPEKDNKACPIWPYEMSIISDLEKYRRIFVLKSRGAGLTELLIRYALFKATSQQQAGNYLLISGPNWNLSRILIQRCKKIFAKHQIYFRDKESVLNLPGDVTISSYPSHNESAIRSLTDVRFILGDEFCFFEKNSDIRAVIDSYVAKDQKVQIALISTPGAPMGLCPDLEAEANGMYKVIHLPYNNLPIYSAEEIQLASLSPNFRREFECAYGYGLGNCLTQEAINSSIAEYNTESDPSVLGSTVVSIGVDIAYGSTSKFSVVSTAIIDGLIYVLDSIQEKQLSFEDSVGIVSRLLTDKYHYYSNKNNIRIFCDASAPAFTRAIKNLVNEPEDYEQTLQYASKNKVDVGDLMVCVPVSFNSDGRVMLQNIQSIVSDNAIRIHPKFKELISDLRVAKVSNTTGNLKKDDSASTWDAIDALRLSCFNYRRRNNG